VAPPSGALFDLGAYTVQPTLLASAVDIGEPWIMATLQGCGVVLDFDSAIEIPPGAGIAMIQLNAAASVAYDNTVVWLEDWI